MACLKVAQAASVPRCYYVTRSNVARATSSFVCCITKEAAIWKQGKCRDHLEARRINNIRLILPTMISKVVL